MFLLVILTYYIATVSSQICSQYYSSTCQTLAQPTITCTDSTPHHCDEEQVPPLAGGNAGQSCVDHASICDTCDRLCYLAGLSTLSPSIPPLTVDSAYVYLSCNTSICTSPPTRSPILPDTPTQTPSISPTTACSTYTCNPSAAPTLNCAGKPTGVYSCNSIGGCSNIDSECSACCFADAQNNNNILGTRQQAFNTLCRIDEICPTVDPTQTPSNNPSATPSNDPSSSPSKSPSKTPSESPSNDPSQSPSKSPVYPSDSPTKYPSKYPSEAPNTPSDTPTTPPNDDSGGDTTEGTQMISIIIP
eukprot:494723_1